jgi:hypothetical protein
MQTDVSTEFNNAVSLSKVAYGQGFTPMLSARCYVENGLLLFGELLMCNEHPAGGLCKIPPLLLN